jgi:hypothetical protein
MYAFPFIFLSDRFISQSSFDDCRFPEHIPFTAQSSNDLFLHVF